MVRHFDAPPERVFDAWLDPKVISKWIGPRVVQAEATKLEPRVGGTYSILMRLLCAVLEAAGTSGACATAIAGISAVAK